MGKASAVISCCLLTAAAAMAQTVPAQTGERVLPQWLTGIIAVAGFLFLTFVGFLVKRVWCEESSRGSAAVEPVGEDESEVRLDTVRGKADKNADNELVLENPEDKVTAM